MSTIGFEIRKIIDYVDTGSSRTKRGKDNREAAQHAGLEEYMRSER
jgi:hypothetical protein